MEIGTNWLAVVLAALSTMVVGSVWYAPKVFGERWMKLARLDKKNLADPKKAILTALVVSFVTAYVLSVAAYVTNSFFGHSYLYDALTAALWLWAGCTAARFVTHDAFENRPRELTIMTITHELVAFLIMGLIIGLLAP